MRCGAYLFVPDIRLLCSENGDANNTKPRIDRTDVCSDAIEMLRVSYLTSEKNIIEYK